MLIGFLTLLATVVIGFPSSGLSGAVNRAARPTPVKRDASLPVDGVGSDSSGGWYEFEDSITATKAVEGHAQKRDAQLNGDAGALAKRQARSEANTIGPDKWMYVAKTPTLHGQLNNAEHFPRNVESDLADNQRETQTSFKRSPNGYSNSGKRNDATMHPVERGSSSNQKRQLSPQANTVVHGIRMHQSYNALRPSQTENAEAIAHNPIAAISDAQPLSESTLKTSSNAEIHAEKRNIAVRSEFPVDSAIETQGNRESRSESELIQRDIGAYQVPTALQATESMGDDEPSPDAEFSETNFNSIEESQTPIKSSLKTTPTDIDLTSQAFKRLVRQPLRQEQSSRTFQPFSESNIIIRRENSPLPGDAMPLFLANYYQQRRCEHHKCHKPKCGKCSKCDNHCGEREISQPTYNSLHMNTNHNLIPRQSLKRNADSQSLKDTAEAVPNSVVRRQATLQRSNDLLKAEENVHAVRRRQAFKHFPSEMLKFELDYTRNKLKEKERNSLRHFKREAMLRQLYDLENHDGKVNNVRKRSYSAVKREVKSFPTEMLKFELDYKKRSIQEKKKLSPTESDMVDRDIKLYQPFNPLQSSEYENAVPFKQYPESDSTNAQQSLQTTLKRSSNGNDYIQKRDAIEMTAQPEKRSASLYGKRELSPETSMIDSDISIYQLSNGFQPTELKNVAIFAQNQENAVQFEQNPQSDSSNAQQSLRTTSKRNSNGNVYNRKRYVMKTHALPMERSGSSYRKTRLNPEARMVDHNIKTYQPFYALQPAISENAEHHPESDNVEQSLRTTFKRSSNENIDNQKRDAIKTYAQPNERSASSYGNTRLHPEASMVDHGDKADQHLYALPRTESDSEPFQQSHEAELSDAQPLIKSKFKRSLDGETGTKKLDTVMTSGYPEASGLYGKRELAPETDMINRDIKLYQPYYALQPIESENAQILQQYPSLSQESLQPSFKRSSDGTSHVRKRDTAMRSHQPVARCSGSHGKRKSSPVFELVNQDAKLNDVPPPIETLHSETIDKQEAADSSAAQESLQATFKRNSDYNSHARKRDTATRFSHPLERGSLNNKRESSPESEMINRDIRLYQPYYALPIMVSETAETLEQNPEAVASSDAQLLIQHAVKRSFKNGSARKREKLRRSTSPDKSDVNLHGQRQLKL